MGLGKTLQSIAFMAHLKHTLQASGPFLVVVPLSVISNWLAEIERFCPRLRPVRFHGPKEERSRIKSDELAASSEFDVVITTVSTCTSAIERDCYMLRVYAALLAAAIAVSTNRARCSVTAQS
jgi:SWI/SNF-related matrix-associated actin-dependent regulator of chromatin subfamily A member 5